MTDAPPRSRKPPRWLAALTFLACAACSGGGSSPTRAVDVEQTRPSDSGLPAVVAVLQKSPDVPAVKAALQMLESTQDRLQAMPLAAGGLKALAEWARLDESDLTELTRVTLSPNTLDPHYLAESILLRDVVRSLALDPHPPLTQARLVFDWVCRQVYDELRERPPVPVWYVLQAGSGGALERAAVFLALLRQAGLDAVLIGPQEAGERPSFVIPPAKGSPAIFWAVGVRVDGDLFLFDVARSRPFPGPKGEGVATLRQAQSDEALAASWVGSDPPAGAARAGDWKGAELFFAVPATAMAPRMAAFEKVLAERIGVRLYADVLAARDRVHRELKSPNPPRFWNVAGDRFNFTRGLGYFLPVDQGGQDRTPKMEQRFFEAYETDLIKWEIYPQLPLHPESIIAKSLRDRYQELLLASFRLRSGSVRDRVLRGQFNDATSQLMELRTSSEAFRGRSATDPTLVKEIEAWSAEAEKRFAEFVVAKRRNDPEAMARSESSLREFEANRSKPVQELLARSVSRVVNMEATFLLALTFHEKASRAQAQPGGSPSAAWRTAADWWGRFLNNHADVQHAYAERFAHARSLKAECERQLTAPPVKK